MGAGMSEAQDQHLLEALLDSWDRNNVILINLLRAVPEGGLEAKATESSPSVAQLFTHIHVRLVFVFEDAPEFASHAPAGEWMVVQDRDRIAQMLNDSAKVAIITAKSSLHSKWRATRLAMRTPGRLRGTSGCAKIAAVRLVRSCGLRRRPQEQPVDLVVSISPRQIDAEFTLTLHARSSADHQVSMSGNERDRERGLERIARALGVWRKITKCVARASRIGWMEQRPSGRDELPPLPGGRDVDAGTN
jgi:hypothetical protein